MRRLAAILCAAALLCACARAENNPQPRLVKMPESAPAKRGLIAARQRGVDETADAQLDLADFLENLAGNHRNDQ